MAGAPVDICNMALAMLGDWQISDMTEQSEEARVCARFYDPVRRSTLMLHDWKCASVRLALPMTEDPLQEARLKWAFSFMMPADCLRARRIEKACNEGDKIPFDLGLKNGQQVVYCNYRYPILEYTADITDSRIFSAEFEQAFYNRLAAAIALPLTQKSQLTQIIDQKVSRAVSAAVAADANQQQERPRELAKWVLARGGLCEGGR